MQRGDSMPGRLRTASGGRLRAVVLAGLVAAWVACLAGPPLAFMRWRAGRLAELSTPRVQADWDAFRADMRSQSGRDGPVQRKVPKSPEPPELVWLRDYPGLAVAAWLIFTGTIGGFVAVLVAGLLRGAVAGSAAEHQPRGDGHHEEQHDDDAEHAEQGRH